MLKYYYNEGGIFFFFLDDKKRKEKSILYEERSQKIPSLKHLHALLFGVNICVLSHAFKALRVLLSVGVSWIFQ
jgi:hypothetical protein